MEKIYVAFGILSVFMSACYVFLIALQCLISWMEDRGWI